MDQINQRLREFSSERLAYSVSDAAAVSGIGRTTLYALIASEQLPSKKIGKRRLIPADGLRRLLGAEGPFSDVAPL